MLIDRSRLAGYLDEAGDDPATAISTLQQHGIANVVLRQLWTGNVLDVPDRAVQRVKMMLRDAGIRTVMLATELGNVPPDELKRVQVEDVDRVFMLASYFGAGMVRIRCGASGPGPEALPAVADWMSLIQDKAISANVTPLLEPSWDQMLYEAGDVAQVLASHPRWKLLYDPAQVCIQRRIDPFVRYWSLLKGKVAAVDLHDLKLGHNFRPPGQGECQLALTLRDADQSKYTGWYFLEPGLGRRYGSATTRQHTFGLAMEGLDHLENS